MKSATGAGVRESATRPGSSIAAPALPSSTLTAADILTPATLDQAAQTLARIGAGARWWIGDLLAALDDATRTGWINSNAAWLDPYESALWRVSAERFPADLRRPDVPWVWHAAIHDLPTATRSELLDRAAGEAWTFAFLKQAAADARKQLGSK